MNLTDLYITGTILDWPGEIFSQLPKLKNIYYLGDDLLFENKQNVTFHFKNNYVESKFKSLYKPYGGFILGAPYTISQDYFVQYSKEYDLIYNTSTNSIIKFMQNTVGQLTIPSKIDNTNITSISASACYDIKKVLHLIK